LSQKVQAPIGLVAGFFGGLSGVWGPPILLYLLSQKTPKTEMIRIQGISFLVGAIVLTGAHLQSGLLNETTTPLSAWMIIPAAAGMAIGFKVQDRMDQAKFRKATLIVLLFAGLNLLRRGLFG
ncbi:MAG: TSUP family transporter, partial [Alphaproteobacteria bacterium]